MSESTLSVNYTELVSAVARQMSYSSRTLGSMNADEQADVVEVIDRGYRQFLAPPPLREGERPHVWSFLTPVTTLTTSAPYTTGTVTVASGVVTLTTDGTFPSWAADGVLTVSGTSYTVSTRDSDTQVTLDDTSVTVAAGASYSLERPDLTLPDDFAGLKGKFTYESQSAKGPVTIIGEGTIRQLRETQRIGTGWPVYAAVRPQGAPSSTVGQRFEVMFWPTPDAAYRLTYSYWVAVNKIDATNTYPLGGALHGETLLASCLAIAEQVQQRDNAAPRRVLFADFMGRLAASIQIDRQQNAPDSFGYNADRSDGMASAGRFGRMDEDIYVYTSGVLYP